MRGANSQAIALQKSSTLFCNDIDLKGALATAVSAMNRSMFIGGFIGSVRVVEARSHVTIERIDGMLRGPGKARLPRYYLFPQGGRVDGTGRRPRDAPRLFYLSATAVRVWITAHSERTR